MVTGVGRRFGRDVGVVANYATVKGPKHTADDVKNTCGPRRWRYNRLPCVYWWDWRGAFLPQGRRFPDREHSAHLLKTGGMSAQRIAQSTREG